MASARCRDKTGGNGWFMIQKSKGKRGNRGRGNGLVSPATKIGNATEVNAIWLFDRVETLDNHSSKGVDLEKKKEGIAWDLNTPGHSPRIKSGCARRLQALTELRIE